MILLPRIAIEQTLGPIKDYLANNGYEVLDLNQRAGQIDADAIIISGQDNNVMGMQDITTTVPVINAKGLTPQEVNRELSERIRS